MKRSLLCAVVSLAVTTGCSAQKNTTSHLKHDVNKPTHDASDSRQWRQMTMEEYLKILGVSVMFGKPLESTDVRTVRAQYWLDKIDTMLRSSHPELKNIPKPEAVVLNSGKINAFVASAPICIEVGLSSEASEGSDLKAVAFRRNSLKIEEFRGECIDSKMDEKNQQEYLTWWSQAFKGCDLKIADKVASVGVGCNKYFGDKPIKSASKIVIFQTSSKVGFFAGTFAKMSEGQFVSVITHELGHYYKSHVSAPSTDYNFFYKMGATNTPSRPKADESLREFGEQVLKISKERIPAGSDFDAIDLAARARIISTMNKAMDMNLAHYTVEQEADELALEWMSKVGVDASYGIEAQLVLSGMAGSSKASIPGWLDSTGCKAAYEKGWKDAQGDALMIAVADWEIHHSPCFRAFNMDREIKAHKYPSSVKPFVGPAPAWDTFQSIDIPESDWDINPIAL